MNAFHARLRGAIACLLLAFAPAAFAQDGQATAGTYMLDGGSYTITVRPEGGTLVVDEPTGKHSVYEPAGGNAYDYFSDITQKRYRLTVLDARTLEASKPDEEGNEPSRLVLIGGGADAPAEPPGDSAKWEAIAEDYSARSESDAANAQAWVTCSAVAIKRSMSTQADADAYASQMGEMLKMMMGEGASSPCPETMAF